MKLVASSFLAIVALWALLASSEHAYAVPAGQPCGALGGAACDKGLWCEPAPGRCASTTGVCVAVPRLCVARRNSRSFRPVCGCNGKTYSGDCFRRAYRVAKFHDGKCSSGAADRAPPMPKR
jgi:hypothetical protein